jgi:hypothetical protein
MSYWVGMTAELCGVSSRNLVATKDSTTHEIS